MDEHEFCAQDWHRCADGGGKGEYDRYIIGACGIPSRANNPRVSALRADAVLDADPGETPAEGLQVREGRLGLRYLRLRRRDAALAEVMSTRMEGSRG